MRVLITGAAGFVGSNLRAELGDAVAATRADADLTDAAQTYALFDRSKPDVVVHLAARVGGITANLERPADFWLDNSRIDANVLAACRRARPRHVIVLLSACMYPDALPAERYPLPEAVIEDGPAPVSNAAYAAAKRSVLHGLRAAAQQDGVGFTALVPCNLYGPHDHFDADRSHFVAAAIAKLVRARAQNEPRVEFFGTGRAVRQYLYAPDLARLVAELAGAAPANDVVNVAPLTALDNRDMAARIARAVGYEGEVGFSGQGPDGQLRKELASTALRARVPSFGARETALERGLEQTVEWYRAQARR